MFASANAPGSSRLHPGSAPNRHLLTRTRFILVLAILLCGPVPVLPQSPAPQTYEHVSENMPTLSATLLPSVPALLSNPAPSAIVPTFASSPVGLAPIVSTDVFALRGIPEHFQPAPLPSSRHIGRYVVRHDALPTDAAERPESRWRLPQMNEVKTLFMTQSRLPLVSLWGGGLQIDGLNTTLNMANIELGPSGGTGLRDFHPVRQKYLSDPHSVDLYAIGVSFHFRGIPQAARPAPVWRVLGQLIH